MWFHFKAPCWCLKQKDEKQYILNRREELCINYTEAQKAGCPTEPGSRISDSRLPSASGKIFINSPLWCQAAASPGSCVSSSSASGILSSCGVIRSWLNSGSRCTWGDPSTLLQLKRKIIWTGTVFQFPVWRRADDGRVLQSVRWRANRKHLRWIFP